MVMKSFPFLYLCSILKSLKESQKMSSTSFAIISSLKDTYSQSKKSSTAENSTARVKAPKLTLIRHLHSLTFHEPKTRGKDGAGKEQFDPASNNTEMGKALMTLMTLGCAGVVYGVHYLQAKEKSEMHKGVIRDKERKAAKKNQSQTQQPQ